MAQGPANGGAPAVNGRAYPIEDHSFDVLVVGAGGVGSAVSTGSGDKFVLELIQRSQKPALLLLNKTDKLKDKSQLLPLIEWYQSEHQ